MEPRKKNAIISAALIVTLFVAYLMMNPKEEMQNQDHLIALNGSTMGTYYNVKYLDPEKRDFKQEIDSLLQVFNQSLSTYIDTSEVSVFNISDTFNFNLPYFLPVLRESRSIWRSTSGAFDPTIMPLVNFWGFGPSERAQPDSIKVDSLLSSVGFDHVIFDSSKVWKTQPNVQLDFSAIAKGYGVDVVAGMLISKGIKNFMVEIGGEVYCQGKNDRGQYWLIGIDNPEAKGIDNYLQAKINIKNRAVATSGNYRNFYTAEGKTYAHTISPFTGYPVQKEVLSASVFAPVCIEADGYATAFMVVGLEQAKEILSENKELDAYLIYRNEQDSLETYYTKGIAEFIK